MAGHLQERMHRAFGVLKFLTIMELPSSLVHISKQAGFDYQYPRLHLDLQLEGIGGGGGTGGYYYTKITRFLPDIEGLWGLSVSELFRDIFSN